MSCERSALRNGSRFETLNVPGDLARVSNPDSELLIRQDGLRLDSAAMLYYLAYR